MFGTIVIVYSFTAMYIICLVVYIFNVEKKEKNFFIINKLFTISMCGIIITIICNIFMKALVGNTILGIIVLLLSIMLVIIISKVLVNIVTKSDTIRFDDNLIYVKDVNVDYSPALLSYLQNQKIEYRKDVVADILNLCAKGVLKFDDNKLIDTNNSKEMLTNDEKYVYEAFIGKRKFIRSEFSKYLKTEFKERKFAKNKTISLYAICDVMSGTLFFMIFTWLLIDSKSFNSGMLGKTLLGVCFTLFFTGAVFRIVKYILSTLNKDIDYKRLSKKGIKEILRWKKFQKYIEEFSNIKEMPIESVALWEKYLAYSMVLNINKEYLGNMNNRVEEIIKMDFDELISDFMYSIDDNWNTFQKSIQDNL